MTNKSADDNFTPTLLPVPVVSAHASAAVLSGVPLACPNNSVAAPNVTFTLTSWYCKAIKGKARPGFLLNQNLKGI